MAKKNVTGQVNDVINNEVAYTQAQDTQNNANMNLDTVDFLINTMNKLVEYVNIAYSRGVFSLEEASNIWNTIVTTQKYLENGVY